MKILLTILISLTYTLHAQTEKKVCFIGNSYTSWNNMSGIVLQLAAADGNTLIKDVHTPGGYTLYSHSTNEISLSKIKSNDWDYVILQDQSWLPSSEWTNVVENVLPYAARLTDSIRLANECAIPIFFNTWGYLDGAAWDSINTFSKMNARLHYAYNYMADINSGKLSPVGIGFEHILNDVDAPITHASLYTGDGSHPSIRGSYLAACMFYEIIFETSSVGNNFVADGLSDTEAEYIQTVANHVLNDVDTISLDYTQPIPDYEVTYDGLTANFTNLSKHAFEYLWDFGDGETSTELDPSHTYPDDAEYIVTLTATYCDKEGISIGGIDHTNLTENNGVKFKIYPNPSSGQQVTIECSDQSQKDIKISNLMGQIVLDSVITEKSVIELPTGFYLVIIDGSVQRLVVQ